MHAVFPPGLGRWGTILALGLAAWAIAAGGQAFADDPCGCNDTCNPPGFWTGSEAFPRDPWYVSTDAMVMQRLFTGMGPVATVGLGPTAAWALTQNDLDQPFQSGAQLLIGHTFDDSLYQVEASYFWLSPWNVTAQAVSPQGNLFSPFTNWGSPKANSEVDDNSFVSIHQISRLEGGEFNVKTALPLPAGDPTIVLMFGVRHVGIREEFDYASVPTGNVNPVSVRAHTNNDLWGPQIGGVIEYGHQDVWIHVDGRAAICDNESNLNLDANVNGIETDHARVYRSNTASVGDINAAIMWRPTSGLTAKVGYRALWVDQIALGGRNFAPNLNELTTAAAELPINTRGTLIYHGPFAGLQLNW